MGTQREGTRCAPRPRKIMNNSSNLPQVDPTLQDNPQPLPLKVEKDFLLPLNAVPVGCMVLGNDLQIEYLNPTAEQALGYSFDETAGRYPTELIFPGEAGSQFSEVMKRIGETQILTQVLKSTAWDGTPRLIRWHFTRWKGATGGVLAVMENDVTGRAEIRHQRQRGRINALRIIDTAISGSMDFQTTLTVILQQMMAHLKMDAAVILVREPSTNSLKFAVGRGLQTNALQYTNLRIGEGLAGKAALNKQIFEAPDLQQHIENSFIRSPLFPREGFLSYYCVPLIAKGEVKGVMESFHRTPFKADTEWLEFFETLGGQAAIAIDNAMMFENLQQSNLDLTLAYDSTLEGWSKALDLRDKDTEGHTRRVTELTDRLARDLGIGEAERVHIRRGAMLHDIGKMGIPDAILLKEGPLSEEEWKIMKQHPDLAMSMLSSISFLRHALDIPYCHHEKWDSSGYPRGLKGREIPIAARIFAVVDVYDALTSDRPYRRSWSGEDALDHIRSGAGSHFDPDAASAFIQQISNQQG
jgi:putative nucleotidyltransferase with HDIG domain/PAS domain S-box-containing protein